MIAKLQNRYNPSIHRRLASNNKGRDKDSKLKEVGDGLLLLNRKRRLLRLPPTLIHILGSLSLVWDLIQVRVLMVMDKAPMEPLPKISLNILRYKVLHSKDTKTNSHSYHHNISIILTISLHLLHRCLLEVVLREYVLMVVK